MRTKAMTFVFLLCFVKQTASGGFDILSHVMETYFSEPNEDNVSDDISEALMKSVIRNLPAALKDPKDGVARSNLLWASTMGENRIIKLGNDDYADFTEEENSSFQNPFDNTGVLDKIFEGVTHPLR